MANGKIASDFEAIIHAGRDRKKNEALAARIFNQNRRASAPFKTSTPTGPGGSLASRAGVNKRVASTHNIPTGPRGGSGMSQHHPGNIEGEWTHDLHATHSAPSTPRGGGGGSLAARISNPKAPAATVVRQKRRAAQVAQALSRTEQHRYQHQQGPSSFQSQRPGGGGGGAAGGASSSSSSPFNKGLTIRGLAGPFVLMAQNFAPGTTAADIESAVTPVGGIVSSCRVVKAQPIVIAEIVLESKEGADNVISTFHNQTADGRVLKVYYKVGGTSTHTNPDTNPINNHHNSNNNIAGGAPQPHSSAPARIPPTGPRAQREEAVVDGTMGFDDSMDATDDHNGGGGYGHTNGSMRGLSGGSGGLYSDGMVRSGSGFRRERGGGGGGFGRGGGGGWGGSGR